MLTIPINTDKPLGWFVDQRCMTYFAAVTSAVLVIYIFFEKLAHYEYKTMYSRSM